MGRLERGLAVFDPIDLHHHTQPVERQQQQAEARGRRRHDAAGEEGEHRADHQQRSEQEVAFVNMAKTRNDAQADGSFIARCAAVGAASVARHPIALWAFVRILRIERGIAERAMRARLG